MVEEDIKILEEFLSKTDVDYAEYFNCTKSLIPDTVEIAIKNILSSYKQLEEENKKFKKYERVVGGMPYINKFEIEKNYIPKSKVKEKIEYYKDFLKTKGLDRWKRLIINNIIDTLEELLREE